MASVISAGTTSNTSLNLSGDTSGVLQLASNGSTTAVTIDTSQNVGIGTASPVEKLTVTGAISLNTDLVLKEGTTARGYIFGTSSGLFYRATSGLPHVFQNVGTELMRIDSSGNVGIGTSSPVTKLTVTGGNGNAITSTNTGQQYSGFEIANNGTNKVTLAYDNTNGIAALNTRGANPFTFGTSDTERMRIDTSGNLLVGCTSDVTSGGFKFFPNYSRTGSSAVEIGHINGSSSGEGFVGFKYNGGTIGSITQSGTTAVAYNTSSDYRLKENIAPMTGALAKVQALKPVTYKWKADGSDGQGFIAHELQAVVPDCVTGEKDAVDEEGKPVYQGIDTSFLVATLTAAIQEQQAQIEELKAELDATKAEVQALKGVA